MSPSGSRYYCSTEQHNDSLSDLTWAGLCVAGETAERMRKSSRLCNQQRRPPASWKSKYASRWLKLQIGIEIFTYSVWGRTNSSVMDVACLRVRIWADELYAKTHSSELNTSTCTRNATVAIVTLLKQLNHLIHSAVFPPKVYLPHTRVHILSHILWPVTVWVIHREMTVYHLVQLCKLRRVIALYFGWWDDN